MKGRASTKAKVLWEMLKIKHKMIIRLTLIGINRKI